MIHTMNTINQLNDKLFYAVATQHLGVGEAKLILHEAVINDDGSVVYGAGGTVIVEPSAVVINREFKTDDTKQVDDKEWIAQLEAMLKSRTQEVKELKASYKSPCDAMGHYGGSPKPVGICPKCNLDW